MRNSVKTINQKCVECGGEILKGVCVECGLVSSTRMMIALPERNYDEPEYKTTAKNLPIKYSIIHSKKTMNTELKRAFKRENIFRNGNPIDYKVIVEIKRIVSQLQLPNIIADEALHIYKSVLRKNPEYFRSKYFRYAALVAYIFIACRIHKILIDLTDLCTFSPEKIGHIKRAYLDCIEFLDLKIGLKIELYVSEACRRLNLPINFEKKIINKLEKIQKKVDISGKYPMGYIAALIHLYGKREFGLRADDIAKILNITPPTLFSRKKEIKRLL